MALHSTPQEHNDNPPSTWRVVKQGRRWHLCRKDSDHPMDSFDTKRQAEAAKTSGFIFDLYNREGKWFAGLPVANWKPYAVCKAEQEPRSMQQS